MKNWLSAYKNANTYETWQDRTKVTATYLLTCSRDIWSQSTVRISDTLTWSYAFDTYLFNYLLNNYNHKTTKTLKPYKKTTNICKTDANVTKAWFRRFLCHPARKQIRPIQQYPSSPTRLGSQNRKQACCNYTNMGICQHYPSDQSKV